VNIGSGIQQKRSQKPLSALLRTGLATDECGFKEMTPSIAMIATLPEAGRSL